MAIRTGWSVATSASTSTVVHMAETLPCCLLSVVCWLFLQPRGAAGALPACSHACAEWPMRPRLGERRAYTAQCKGISRTECTASPRTEAAFRRESGFLVSMGAVDLGERFSEVNG